MVLPAQIFGLCKIWVFNANASQPEVRFLRLFQSDGELMDEILCGFRGSRFRIIRTNR